MTTTEKFNAADARGWRILYTTPHALCSRATFDLVGEAVKR